jgi:hypothetical protein
VETNTNLSIMHFKTTPHKHPLAVPKVDGAEVENDPLHHSVWTQHEVPLHSLHDSHFTLLEKK